MQVLVDLVGVLIWPLTLIVALLVLREPVRALLPRFKSGEIMGARVEFDIGIEQAVTKNPVTLASVNFSPVAAPPASSDGLSPEQAEQAARATEALRDGYLYAQQHLREALSVVGENPNLGTMLAARFMHGELIVALTQAASRSEVELSSILGRTEEIAEKLKGLTPLTDYALDHLKQIAQISRAISQDGASIDAHSASVLVMFVARSAAPIRAYELLDGDLKELI